MLETFPPGSMDLEGLRISSPELHAAITSGESERVVDVLRNLERIEREVGLALHYVLHYL